MIPAWRQSLDYWLPGVQIGALLVLALGGVAALLHAIGRGAMRSMGDRYGAALKDLGLVYSFDASRVKSEEYSNFHFFSPRPFPGYWDFFSLSSGMIDGVDCRAFFSYTATNSNDFWMLAAFRTPGTHRPAGFRREMTDDSGRTRWFVDGGGEWLLFYRARYPRSAMGWFIAEPNVLPPNDEAGMRAFFVRALELNRELNGPASS
ncbi:MAG: hypothetical protein ACHQ51_07530 [Elusimicrobiota bacterium]